VLQPGGEFVISDIVADRRVPEAIRGHPKLVAECLGGALYEQDFLELIEECGFRSARILSRTLVEEDVCGHPIRFYSITVRGFRFPEPLDRRHEDYGQVATYRGNCEAQPARFVLDQEHAFEAGRPTPVSRNTARMLSETRLGRYFEVSAPRAHFGLFNPAALAGARPPSAGACC
jgi:hypothetical protein